MAANHSSLWKRTWRRTSCINCDLSFFEFAMQKLIWPCAGFLGVLLLLFLSGAGGGENSNYPRGSATTSDQGVSFKNSDTSKRLGETITTDQFEISINSIEIEPVVGMKYNESIADKGYVYVVVNWQYKSILLEPVMNFPSPSIRLQDGDNNLISSDFSATESYASEYDLNRERFKALVSGRVVEEAEVYLVDRMQYKQGQWRVQIIADTDSYVNIKR